MKQVLFVCSGNICRSPLAQYLFQDLAEKKRPGEIRALSCGTLKLGGSEAAPHTLEVLRERGIDASAHRSTALNYYHLFQSDLVICMEPHHLDAVQAEAGDDPEIMQRVFVITEFHPDPRQRNAGGVYDFVTEPLEVYREMAEEFVPMLENVLEFLGRE